MGLSEARVRQIIREELSRESRLQEGFFDTIKGFFGGNDPYEHFTTKHEKWQVMKSKMDKGVSPLNFLKDLDSGALDAKFIPKEWNSNPRDRKAYREAMKRAILDYNVKAIAKLRDKEIEKKKLRDKEREERERSVRLRKKADQERDVFKPWHGDPLGLSGRRERDPVKYDDDEPEDPYKFRGVDRHGAPSNPSIGYYNTSDVDQPDYDELRKLS